MSDPGSTSARSDQRDGAAAPEAVEALLFDLDGTLIDSMPLHHTAWATWHRRHGLPFDDAGFFAATAGRSNAEILLDLLPQLDDAQRRALAQEKEQLYRAAAAHALRLIPGFAAVQRAARERGLKLAICTASPQANIDVAVRRFGLDRLVDTIASPADGLRGKPHPDLFLEAARRLGVAPARCVVFEDAPLGVEAARRAGMRAVALTTSLPAAAFADHPNLLHAMPDFEGFDLRSLLPENTKEIRHA